MKINVMVSLGGAAVLMAATPSLAQDHVYDWTPAGSVTPVPPGPDFLALAGGSDRYEIESSQAVLETTADAQVRAFAEMMIAHHSQTSADAMAAARRAGLTPPHPMLNPAQASMIAALRRFQGAERDRLYLTQQTMAHKEALGVMKTYAEGGDTPELRTAAAAATPIIQRHLAELERLSR